MEENELGVVVKSFRNISEAVKLLLKNGRLEKFRNNAKSIHNNALFEIPSIFDKIMMLSESANEPEALTLGREDMSPRARAAQPPPNAAL